MKLQTKLAVVAAAAGLATAGAASAATYIENWTTSPNGAISVSIGDNGLSVAGGSLDPLNGISTHAYNTTTGAFTDTFDFNLLTGKSGASVISTLSGTSTDDLNFSGITFNSVSGTTFTGGGISMAHVGLQPVTLGGKQELVISGVGGPSATFGGTVNFVLNSAAVPEPASWALLIVGFGGAGAMLRKRRSVAAAI